MIAAEDVFADAPPGVRLAFSVPLRAEGVLKISRSLTLLGRFFVRSVPLPPAGDAVLTTLDVTPTQNGTRWVRSFGSFRAESETKREGGRLIERTGPFEFIFDEQITSTKVVHDGHCRKVFGIPFPGFLGPKIHGEIFPAEDDRSWQILVEASHWLVGTVVRYEGTMRAL